MKKVLSNDKNRFLISLIFKICIFSFALAGVILNYYHGFSKGKATFLFFTCQSNIWIGVFDLIMIFIILVKLYKTDFNIPKIYSYISQVLTVSIALTGIVYTLILAPGVYFFKPEMLETYNPFHLGSIFAHVLVPILSVVDFLIFTRKMHFKKIDCLYALIPPIYYFFFALIGYFANWDFGHGNNYPYFFLNYDNPAGLFGFSNEAPYFMGNFYWFILGMGIVIGLSSLFILIINKVNKEKIDKAY